MFLTLIVSVALTLTINGLPVALHRAGAGVGVKKQSALAAKAAKANKLSDEDADREAMAQAQAWLAQNGHLWEVCDGQLFMSSGQNPVQLLQPFSVTLNSSGSPIIASLGKEYSRCN